MHYDYLYNSQINARPLIGQSAVGYCACKPIETCGLSTIYMTKAGRFVSEQGHLKPRCHSKARPPNRQLWNKKQHIYVDVVMVVVVVFAFNCIYNKILDRDWFPWRLFVT